MPGKIGTAISGLVLGLGLAAIGFDPKAGVTEGIVMGLRIIMSLLPAVIMALGIIAFYFFPLTDTKMFEIHQQAEEIKASAREAASAQFK
jgi:Na+/melibiose symporter-like transporter